MTTGIESAELQPDASSPEPASSAEIIAFPRLELARRRLKRACDGFLAPEAAFDEARAKLDGYALALDQSVKRLDDVRDLLDREADRARAIAAEAERLEAAIMSGDIAALIG